MNQEPSKTNQEVRALIAESAEAIIREALADQPEEILATFDSLLEVYLDAVPATQDGDMSYESIILAVQDACKEYDETGDQGSNGGMSQAYHPPHQVVATFPDSVVFSCNGTFYMSDYTINGNEVELTGDPTEVTAEFKAVPTPTAADMNESQVLVEARPAGSINGGKINRALNIIEGTTLIGAMSSNGVNHKRRYSEGALKKIAAMAEGLPGYLNHVKPEDAFKPRDVREIAVRHQNVRFDPTTQTVKSDMHVLEHHKDLVFNLAERFGDHIGNSLVSKGAVTMEGDTEVVQDILALRSADLVSDPATTKGLFEHTGNGNTQLTILDLIESIKQGGDVVDIATILTHLKDKPEDQKLLAEHFGWVLKTDGAKLSESIVSLGKERDDLKAKVTKLDEDIVSKDKLLSEAKVELDGFKAKDAVAAKRVKLQEAIDGHPLKKEFGSVKAVMSTEFIAMLESMDESSWKKMLDDRYALVKSAPRGSQPQSDLKDLSESSNGLPQDAHARFAAMVR